MTATAQHRWWNTPQKKLSERWSVLLNVGLHKSSQYWKKLVSSFAEDVQDSKYCSRFGIFCFYHVFWNVGFFFQNGWLQSVRNCMGNQFFDYIVFLKSGEITRCTLDYFPNAFRNGRSMAATRHSELWEFELNLEDWKQYCSFWENFLKTPFY